MNDILNQTMVTTANGEKVLFADLRENAARDGKREEYEARRLDNFMRLGVRSRAEGPLMVTDTSVSILSDKKDSPDAPLQ